MPTKTLNRVLYVEDDEDIQRIVRMSLERVGKMTVRIVGDPRVAIDEILAFKPDLVMLDWMMPDLDGPTLFRKMRSTPGTLDLPVVFITAKTASAEMDELLALGACGAIAKPFSPTELPARLRSFWDSLP